MATNKRPPIAFPAVNSDYRAARLRTALACQTYNKLPEDAPDEQRVAHWRNIINSPLSPSSSSSCSSTSTSPPRAPYIKSPVHIDYGSNLQIGSSTFINRNCTILDTPVLPVRIGERCLLGPNVSHPVDWQERNGPLGAPSCASEVVIEDDCWIGGGVTVLPGVTVGRGCVVGAGSVVTRDIPSEHLAFGVPARIIRSITEETPVTCSESQGVLTTGGQSLPKGMDKVATAVNPKDIEVQWGTMLAVLLTMLGLWALVHYLLG